MVNHLTIRLISILAGDRAGRDVLGQVGRKASPSFIARSLRAIKDVTLHIVLALSVSLSAAQAVTLPNTPINNIATASYAVAGKNITLNANALVNTAMCVPSKIEFLQYVPGAAVQGATPVTVGVTQYSASGSAAGPFLPSPGPIPLGQTVPLPSPGTYNLAASNLFTHNEPIFIRVTSFDQNLNAFLADAVVATVVTASGDSETLSLTETGPSTGVFVGYVQSSGLAAGTLAVANNNALSLQPNEAITATSVDTCNGVTSTSVAQALADPYGLVFDSSTGLPLNGASITIIDVATGLPAKVFGNDGVSAYPSTILSGSTVTDAAGVVYAMPPGMFRFPLVAPGTYRFQVVAPAKYRGPSTVPTAALQLLAGAPFAIALGSRGENFVINPGPAVHIDIPLDPGSTAMTITKTVAKAVAGNGDFVPYTLNVANNDPLFPLAGAQIADRMPIGFRYQKGSATLNGVAMPDPIVSADARTLIFTIPNIPAAGTAVIKYVLLITPSAPTGPAENVAAATGGYTSNTARASLVVREDLYRNKSILIGRVIDGSCDDKVDNDAKGLAGARVVLEDGTQVLTDKEGRWHMDNLRAGTHVVQLDLDSLPKNYEVMECEQNTRFAGRSYSQFVNLQGGTMWRADFHVQKKAPIALRLTQSLGVKSLDEQTVVSLALLSSTEVTGYSATLILPAGSSLIPGSATLNGEAIADPDVSGQALTFRSLARPAQWQDQYFVSVQNVGPKATFKSLVRFTPPGRSAQNLPLAEVTLRNHAPATAGTYGEVLVESDDLKPAKTKDDDNVSNLVEKLPYDDVWLSKAQPGVEWLHPQASFHPNLPVVSVAVKHEVKQSVQLTVNGEAVSALKFYGMRYNTARTVALSSWRGVPINAGDNVLEMTVLDENGEEVSHSTRTIHYGELMDHVEYVPELSRLIADGKTRPVIAVRFLDKDGGTVRRGINGEFDLNEPYRSYDRREATDRQPLTSRVGGKARYEIREDGIALIELEPTTQSGEAVLNFQFADRRKQEVRAWLQAQQRDWVLVGFAEGSVGQKSMSGNMEALQANATDTKLYDNNKMAFYAKGSIKGEYLLTAAYDTAKQTGNKLLKQAVDPTQYYTLYADATQANFDAATSSRLYVKLEKKQFYAMFGDYDTGMTVTELSRYSRTLNGVKSEYKGDTLGYNAFASTTAQAYVKDELPGNGTSGIYKLSRTNLLANSDKIRIETRDRFQSQVIVTTQTMTRYLDYDIDYTLGTLVFRQPVQTRDAAFNPTYIIAEYESQDTIDTRTTLGGRGSYKPIKALELGATTVHEGTVGASGTLQGADATYKLDEQTKVRGEIAASNNLRAGQQLNGSAWLTEVTHHEEQWDGKAYMRAQGGSFGMGQQSIVEMATRKMGADGRYKFDDTTSIKAQAYQQDNQTTNYKNTLVEARVDNQISSALSAYYGARKSVDQSAMFGNKQSNQFLAGTAYSMLDNKLSLRAGGEVGSGSVSSTAGSITMPNRLLLGADYKVSQQSKVFVEQEFAHGDKMTSQTTRAGIRTQPWMGAEMSASMGDSFNNDAERMYGNLGMVQRWQIDEHWQTDFSIDRSITLRNTVSPLQVTNAPLPSGTMPLPNGAMSDYTATSVGGAYHDTVWSSNGRLELRNSTLAQQRNMKFGAQRKLDEGRSMAAGITLMNATGVTTSNNTDVRASYAHRPNDSEWVWLDRADYITQFSQNAGSVLKTKKLVNNVNANWMANRHTQLSFQYGVKYVLDNIQGIDYKGYTDLFGAEARYDLSEDWDIGGFGTMMRSVAAGVRSYGMGASLGYQMMTNTWLAFGYNLRGMADRDFAGAGYKNRGPFVTLRMKVDQDTLGLNDHGERTRPLAAE
ncbi:MAG: hypothetical protein ABL856_02950 [Gallionella sp.]